VIRAGVVGIVVIVLVATVGVLAMAKFVAFIVPAYRTAKTLILNPIRRSSRAQSTDRASGDPLPSVLSPSSAAAEEEALAADEFALAECAYNVRFWLCFSTFILLEPLIDMFLAFLPYGVALKSAFLLSLALERSPTVEFAYSGLRYVSREKKQQIEEAIEFGAASAAQLLREVKAIVWHHAIDALSKLRSRSSEQNAAASDASSAGGINNVAPMQPHDNMRIVK
jgi:hypothetical protein